LTEIGLIEIVKLFIFYASWLYWPTIIALGFLIFVGQRLTKIFAIAVLLSLTILAYARFVEPRILLTSHHDIQLKHCYDVSGPAKIAVFSDTHIGLYKNAMPLQRVVKAINKNNPDAVLIAGDFVYFLSPKRFKKAFDGLKNITAPVFVVMGNHDVGLPGPDMTQSLSSYFAKSDIHLIDNKTITSQNGFELIGLSDSWQERQNFTLLDQPTTKPRLVLTHNPETIEKLKPGSFDLLIAGHTHGGQINIPFVTCNLIDIACAITRYGYKKTHNGDVFVTSGTGMVGLPMRFNVPPKLDIINLHYPACAQ